VIWLLLFTDGFSVDLVLLLFLHHIPFAVSLHMNFLCYFHFQFFFFIYVKLMKESAFIVFWRNLWFSKQANDPKNIVHTTYACFRWRFLSKKTENQCQCSTCVIQHIFFFRLNAPTKLLTLYMSKYFIYNGYIFICYCIIMYV